MFTLLILLVTVYRYRFAIPKVCFTANRDLGMRHRGMGIVKSWSQASGPQTPTGLPYLGRAGRLSGDLAVLDWLTVTVYKFLTTPHRAHGSELAPNQLLQRLSTGCPTPWRLTAQRVARSTITQMQRENSGKKSFRLRRLDIRIGSPHHRFRTSLLQKKTDVLTPDSSSRLAHAWSWQW